MDSSIIKPIETYYDGYRFRSRLEAKWAVFFNALGIDYEYEIEGYNMGDINYLPDFYLPNLNRWFEIKGKPLSIKEIKKCEKFCREMDNDNIKYSILIGAPEAIRIDNYYGIEEYVWEWPSDVYPDNYRLMAPNKLVEEEYYSRFMRGLWVVSGVNEEELAHAAIIARSARFEFGEKPLV